MRWLNLFRKTNCAPSHGQIRQKVEAIKSGEDSSSQTVSHQKNEFTAQLLKIDQKNKMVERGAKKTKKLIDTAIAIAIASGGLEYDQL
jgi:hypothetical protein